MKKAAIKSQEPRAKSQEPRAKSQEPRAKKSLVQVSVIVCTKNRPAQLAQCLEALEKSSYSDFELIVVDQSDQLTPHPSVLAQLKKFSRFQFVKSVQSGKSLALNQAITFSNSQLLAFTDDDCLPNRDWLTQIVASFTKHQDIAGIFGRTTAHQPQQHPDQFCPCTFENRRSQPHLIIKPDKHWETIGFGNNMAFRKETFIKLGGFKEWLGPGSIGSNAEEAELALRTLIAGRALFYNPKMLVAHDKWVKNSQKDQTSLSYICGEMACYGYLALEGHRFAQQVIKDNFKDNFYHEPKEIYYALVHLKKDIWSQVYWWPARTLARFRGLAVAGWFYLKKIGQKSPASASSPALS